jgi:hypothetical protein
MASSKEKGAAALVRQMTEWLTAQHAEGAEA